MQTELQEPAGDCEWVLCREPLHADSPVPYQMSFLSPIAGASAGSAQAVEGARSARGDARGAGAPARRARWSWNPWRMRQACRR